ncbi:MAG: 50S ribosomal protein L4 [Nanoarchaeota archaeon]|nr:50S ribosomal protein L4 [Nanoarchaeota archaeon]
MKAVLLDTNGKEKGKIDLPKSFSTKIREDIVFKVLEVKKKNQPYSPSLVAGKQHSASGKMRHRRHVWQTHYGRGMSRIPRKVMSRRGTQFNWEGAEVSSTKGGRRAHPPKTISMINVKRLNKKELAMAFSSAISATASEKYLKNKYKTLKNEKIKEVPFIVESNILNLKAKDLLSSIRNILGEKLFGIAIRKKTQRAGKGKMRGRKYKTNAGLLMVVGNKEKIKTGNFEIVPIERLGIMDLAEGGLGRLTIYTEEAIKDMGEKQK